MSVKTVSNIINLKEIILLESEVPEKSDERNACQWKNAEPGISNRLCG